MGPQPLDVPKVLVIQSGEKRVLKKIVILTHGMNCSQIRRKPTKL